MAQDSIIGIPETFYTYSLLPDFGYEEIKCQNDQEDRVTQAEAEPRIRIWLGPESMSLNANYTNNETTIFIIRPK